MLKFKENSFEVGIDEAGRGPLLGPVYAAAVIWDIDDDIEFIKDSKKLSKKKRKEAYDWILKNVKYWGIGFATEEEIDKINILNATKLAMDRSINDTKQKLKNNLKINSLIIDGTNWEKFNFDYKTESIVKGDSKYYSIAAASILAKESHDRYIKDLIKENPDLIEKYDLENNMGYGTKKHLQGLVNYGPSKFHRISFKRCH